MGAERGWQGARVGAMSRKNAFEVCFGAKPALRPSDRLSRGRTANTRAKRSGSTIRLPGAFSSDADVNAPNIKFTRVKVD
jgi:hypothetical protein